MTQHIGQRFGDYRLSKYLGGGGFADVYLGEHVYLSTKEHPVEAAVKVLKGPFTAREIAEFRNEAQTTLRLEHPHIVQLITFSLAKIKEQETPFLVMPYAIHGSLDKRHPRGTKIPLPTIISYVQQIAEALQYAHDHKVIHRDIKPANFLLGNNENILLSDFGIALVAHRTVSWVQQNIAGSQPYMAPEQFRGEAQSASDIYSLGVTVYQWLCGELPFSKGDMGYQHNHTSPPQLREKMPSISPEVEKVVMKALAKDPHQRWPDVQAFALSLAQAYQAELHSPRENQIAIVETSIEDFRIRTVLNGKYRIVQVLEWGRCGDVYKVERMEMPSYCYAVKELFLPPSKELWGTSVALCHKEAELLRDLKHPRIPLCVSSFQERGSYYFVMELIAGQNLKKILEENKGPLDETRVINWAMQVCEALTYLHSHTPPIVLCEIKPSDIMLTVGGDIRLMDVGTTRRCTAELTNYQHHLTIYAYMSPESASEYREYRDKPPRRKCKIDARSDIFSLGALIYQLLTNEEPSLILGPEPGDILAKNPQLHTEHIANKIVCPIEQIIIKSRKGDPNLRFQSAAAMRTALQYCLSKREK